MAASSEECQMGRRHSPPVRNSEAETDTGTSAAGKTPETQARCRHQRLTASVLLNVACFIVIIGLAVGTALSKRSVHVEVCPHDWITYRKKCYYFSEKEGDWNSSNEFCLSHNASLARIEDDEETFCRILDMKRSYWIGIQQETGETWKWLNGDIAKMKVIGGGDCAFWTAKESNARASRCTSGHYWFCSKSATSTNHKEI